MEIGAEKNEEERNENLSVFCMVLLCFPIPGSGPGSTSSLRYTSGTCPIRFVRGDAATLRRRRLQRYFPRYRRARLHAAAAIVKSNVITDIAGPHYHCRC